MSNFINSKDAFDIFKQAYSAVLPNSIISKSISIRKKVLKINEKEYVLNNNLWIIAFGKAVIGMVRSVQEILHEHIVKGICSLSMGIIDAIISSGNIEMIPISDSKIELFEGAKNNIPDELSLATSKKIYNLLQEISNDDILLVLVSGGGSALLSYPEDPVSLEDLVALTKLMSCSAATIDQLNTLRKNIEVLKGGGISKISYPSKVIALILSDVIGDDLEFIASGPTIPNTTTPVQCLQILDDLKIFDQVPNSIKFLLKSKIKEIDPQDVDKHIQIVNNCYLNTQNVIIGSNKMAVDAASVYCDQIGFFPVVLTCGAKGKAVDWAKLFYSLTKYCVSTNDFDENELSENFTALNINQDKLTEIKSNIEKRDSNGKNSKVICIMSAGETTVKVEGQGKGGRNQHMVLHYAFLISQYLKDSLRERDSLVFSFLSCGTDGQDGPTEAAGAFFDSDAIPNDRELSIANEMLMKLRLEECNSYAFFQEFYDGKYHVKTGLTGTNVMDLQILLIKIN